MQHRFMCQVLVKHKNNINIYIYHFISQQCFYLVSRNSADTVYLHPNFIGCCVLLPFGNNFFNELLMFPTGNCFAFLDFICIVNCIFLCPFGLFKILRFLLFTIIFWLITKILLENNNIYIFTIYLTYTIYPSSFQYNDITQRVVMFP